MGKKRIDFKSKLILIRCVGSLGKIFLTFFEPRSSYVYKGDGVKIAIRINNIYII